MSDTSLPVLTPNAAHWRTWLALFAQAMATGLAVSLVLLLIVVIATSTAQAATRNAPASQTFSVVPDTASGSGAHALPASLARLPRGEQISGGSALLFQTSAGPVAAPLQSTRVSLLVTGHTVRARVSQTYRNPSGQWLDGIYRFPLPDDSAVDTMQMRVGGRTINGVIQERKRARKNYERARREGKRASLVSQAKPNDFTARVANIGPHGDISIDIEYQQVMAMTPDGWTLRFPTVVAPRYTPLPAQLPEAAPGSSRPLERDAIRIDPADLRSVAHDAREQDHRTARQSREQTMASDIEHSPQDAQTPTLLHRDPRQNRIEIEVLIDAGVPATIPRSATHQIDVQTLGDKARNNYSSEEQSAGDSTGRYRALLSADEIADRDFELQWAPVAGALPAGSVQFEKFDNAWYGLLVVSPPDPDKTPALAQPREVIFVIDTSGSMHGESLEQARDALRFGLQRLSPEDRFNVIQFNSRYELLYRKSRPANERNLAAALRYLDGLQANGGTEMLGALEQALVPAVPAGFISQVVFITDGAVSNETALFNTIESELGKRRLFTVGIGSAPNGFFMRKAAAAGRGSFTLVAKVNQVQERMGRLFEQLASPMLTDLKLRTVRGDLIATDLPIRDLYAAEPVVHQFRLDSRPQAVFVEGDRAGQAWQQEIRVIDAPDSGVHRLWAKAALDELSADIRRPGLSVVQRDELREDATKLALKHHLVSDYTSLVAIDVTPARPAGSDSKETTVPRHSPKGWNVNAVFGSGQGGGSLAQGSTGVWQQLLTGALLLLLAVGFGAGFLTRAEKLLNA